MTVKLRQRLHISIFSLFVLFCFVCLFYVIVCVSHLFVLIFLTPKVLTLTGRDVVIQHVLIWAVFVFPFIFYNLKKVFILFYALVCVCSLRLSVMAVRCRTVILCIVTLGSRLFFSHFRWTLVWRHSVQCSTVRDWSSSPIGRHSHTDSVFPSVCSLSVLHLGLGSMGSRDLRDINGSVLNRCPSPLPSLPLIQISFLLTFFVNCALLYFVSDS